MLTDLENDQIGLRPELSEIITAEFNYIAQTAFQANEDRARVSTFYLLSVGSLIAAVITSQPSTFDQNTMAWAFMFLFGILSISGLLTILQLARLRSAWFESAKAMNHLKRYCVDNVDTVTMEQIFRWSDNTLPQPVSFVSISFLMAFQVIILSSLMIGMCVYHVGVVRGYWWLYQSVWAGMIALIPLFFSYFWAVKD